MDSRIKFLVRFVPLQTAMRIIAWWDGTPAPTSSTTAQVDPSLFSGTTVQEEDQTPDIEEVVKSLGPTDLW